jgi:hypothetical protein
MSQLAQAFSVHETWRRSKLSSASTSEYIRSTLFVPSRIRAVVLLAAILCSLLADADCGIGKALAADRPNVLLICVDDLRPELACYGVDYIHSPNIDELASQGQLFTRHYVQAPTCGASRYALLTGRYGGAGNSALFERAAKMAEGENIPPSRLVPAAWLYNCFRR